MSTISPEKILLIKWIIGVLVISWIITVAIVNIYPDSEFIKKYLSWAVPNFLVRSESSSSTHPPPAVTPAVVAIDSGTGGNSAASASTTSGGSSSTPPPPATVTPTFKSGKGKAQCPVWKSTFSKSSYDYQNFNPASLQRGSPNVTAIGNYCGLGNKITQYCTDTKKTLGIEDPNFPNPNSCDNIDCATADPSPSLTYGKLCKSLQCTLNNSDFLNYEWSIAGPKGGDDLTSDPTGKESLKTVFDKNGNLKFNIFAIDQQGSNADFLNAFCDTGRRMLADPNCNKEYQNYVANSAAFKYFCCNDTNCCPDNVPECSGKPKCSTVCTQAAADCVLSKGEFVQGSYNYQNFNPASLTNESNLNGMMDYCSFGDDLIAQGCKIDKYHPQAPDNTAYVLNPWDPTPSTPAGTYKQFCAMNPACLKQIGKFNKGQWEYQGDAFDILSGSEFNPVSRLAQCSSNPSTAYPETCVPACTPEVSAEYKELCDSCVTDPTSEDCKMCSTQQCVNDCNTSMYLQSCKLTENGTRLTDWCDMGTNLYQNKCYDTFTVNPLDDNASNYPPIQYDMPYTTMCCGLGLGDEKLCDTNPNVMSQIPNVLSDKRETNKSAYQYLMARRLKLQK